MLKLGIWSLQHPNSGRRTVCIFAELLKSPYRVQFLPNFMILRYLLSWWCLPQKDCLLPQLLLITKWIFYLKMVKPSAKSLSEQLHFNCKMKGKNIVSGQPEMKDLQFSW